MFEDIKSILLTKDIVIDNEYLNKYVDLLEQNRNQEKIIYKTQQHHIIPRFVFEHMNEVCDNSTNNLVNLFYKDHVLAHFYLAMCAKYSYIKTGNLCAVREVIYGKDSNATERLLLDKLPELQLFYEESKHINCLKEDTPEKISAALTGGKYVYNSDTGEYRCCKGELLETLLSQGWIYKHPPQSLETRDKISFLRTGKRTIYKEDVVKQVHETELQSYLDAGWTRGDPRQKGRKSSIKGKIAVTDGNITRYIDPSEVAALMLEGFTLGNNQKGKKGCNKGVKFTQDHIDKIVKQRVGRVGINNGVKNKYVYPHELDSYLAQGWFQGTKSINHPGTSGKVWINNGECEKYVSKDELNLFLNDSEWQRGRVSRKINDKGGGFLWDL